MQMLGIKMSAAKYREANGINRSNLFQITKSPLHFKYALENPAELTPSLVFGSAVHKYILEPEEFNNEYAVLPNSIDRRTKAGKAAYDAFWEENGDKNLISNDDMIIITKMADVVKNNIFVKRLLEGEHETSFFWDDELTGEKCKCRPDCITKVGEQYVIVDYKTTDNAETEAFRSSSIKYGYDLQAGMYLEGVKVNTGLDCVFIFIAQEKKPPYAVNILQADEFMVKEGQRLFHDLLGIYHECRITNNWYGYEGPDGGVSNLTLPKWLLKEFV